MTALAIGGVAAQILATAANGGRRPTRSGATHRTGAPVLRDSLEEGTFEDAFFAIPAKGEADRMAAAARKALDAGRKLKRDARSSGEKLSAAERAVAALTSGAVRVFEELCMLARTCEGRVFPTYDWLAEKTGLGRQTVARAIPILDRAGFLVKQRRFKRVEQRDDDGNQAEVGKPRYRQTSNAYRPMLPKAVVKYLPRFMRPAPAPADAVQREAERLEDQQRMLKQLSCRDFARAVVGGSLGEALAKLGAGLDARAEAHAEVSGASAIMMRNR